MKPVIIKKSEHQIQIDQLDSRVVKILKKLKQAKFQAYLVGGGVRDLLLGYKPKDFDIATDARPEQIRTLFSNSRIIGRRFRLVHIFFGRDVIEVATFRAPPNIEEQPNIKQLKEINNDHHLTDDGRIIRDNTYGELEDDIWRRDFSINALYYDAIEETIVDYCHGYQDLKNHTIKILGDAQTRYREDPVRMLRALRFAAKLDFQIEQKTLEPIENYKFHSLLDDIPRARLFEEYNKFFLTGHAEKSFYYLCKYKLFHQLFPYTATQVIEDQFPQHLSFLHAVLKSTDSRFENELPINPAFLIAAFLWHPLLAEKNSINSKNNKEFIWRQAAQIIIKKQNQQLAIPKRFTLIMEDIWHLQRMFYKNNKKSIEKAARHPKFRAGFDFLNLRANTEQVDSGKLKWWQEFEASDSIKREKILESL